MKHAPLKKEKKVMEFREVNVLCKLFKSSAAFYRQEQWLQPFTVKEPSSNVKVVQHSYTLPSNLLLV
jgi:hypothetical protein